MSNETTQKRSLSVSLGAAFLMATSAIGPGFLTQTSQFTAKYLSLIHISEPTRPY